MGAQRSGRGARPTRGGRGWLGFVALFVLVGCLRVPSAGGDGDSSAGSTTSGSTATGTGVDATSSPSSSDGTDPTEASSSTTGGDDATAGSTGGDPGVIEVEGEILEVDPGWAAGVFRDFSVDFVFDADAYFDDPYTFNNAPQSMFVLRAPFAAGLGIITVHTVIELSAEQGFAERFYFGATPDGPDALWQAVDCAGWNGIEAGYCLNSGSQGGGDGLFLISPDWSMSVIEVINNCNYIGFDPQGKFDETNVPSLYYGTPTSLVRHPSTVLVSARTQPRFVLEDGRLAFILDDARVQRLMLMESITHVQSVVTSEPLPELPIARQNAGALRIATGDLSALPGSMYFLRRASELVELAGDGTTRTVARSQSGQDWRWASVVVPEPGHPLSTDGPTFYLLEANRTDDRDRVIWLRPGS
jgi:hypothetical protein